jgi:hypothetical protein
MDPKSIAKLTIPPPCREVIDPQAEIWEPPFERWQRLTEALISNAADEPSTRMPGAKAPIAF